MDILPTKPINRWVKNRISKNKNVIIVINGETGSGKTYAAIQKATEMAKVMGTPFTIEHNVDFHFNTLLQKMKLPQNQKPGTCFVFEEVGSFSSGASSKQWQSNANKFFNSFMQTSRHRNQILFFTCPHFCFLDKSTRLLCHMQWEMDGIDFNKKLSFVKPYRIQVNKRTGKFYFKYLRCSHHGGGFKLSKIAVPYPDETMVREYEIMKTRFTGKLNQSIIDSVKEEVKTTIGTYGKVNMKVLAEYIKKGLSAKQIAKLMDVTERTIYNYKDKLNNERIEEQNKLNNEEKITFSLGKPTFGTEKPFSMPV